MRSTCSARDGVPHETSTSSSSARRSAAAARVRRGPGGARQPPVDRPRGVRVERQPRPAHGRARRPRVHPRPRRQHDLGLDAHGGAALDPRALTAFPAARRSRTRSSSPSPARLRHAGSRRSTPLTPGLHRRYRLGGAVLRAGARLGGTRLPPADRRLRSMPAPASPAGCGDVLATGASPTCGRSRARRSLACQAGRRAGSTSRGARFTGGGEPTTAAGATAVEAAGAELHSQRTGRPRPTSSRTPARAPGAGDDMHFFRDARRAARRRRSASRGRRSSVTSLLPTAPIVLFNVSLGD